MNINLPENCWRDSTSIYLNPDTKPPLIQFTVENGNIKIKKNNMHKTLEENINRTFQEEIKINYERLKALENKTIEKTIEFILKFPEYNMRLAYSGGKDSDVLLHIWLNKIQPILNIDYVVDFNNTSNDTAQTYLHVKQDTPKDKLKIHNPKKGFYKWLTEDKDYFIPTVFIRNCCSTYKESRLSDYLTKKNKYIILLGMRKSESKKRALYDYDMNDTMEKSGKTNIFPDNWKRFLPIVEWTDTDIWLYILLNNISFNKMYKIGFSRCGCLICPYQHDYIDLLVKEFYPLIWNRWEKIVKENYIRKNVESRLKWTLEEYINGKWKLGKSKEIFLIKFKPTKKRVGELAKIKGISEDLAIKYFNRQCNCGKRLNPDEIALNLKTYGREMDLNKMQCKTCYCKAFNITGKEYKERIQYFRNEGCALF